MELGAKVYWSRFWTTWTTDHASASFAGKGSPLKVDLDLNQTGICMISQYLDMTIVVYLLVLG